MHCVRVYYTVYSNTVHDTHAVQVTICSHSTDEALHIFHASTVSQVLTLAPEDGFHVDQNMLERFYLF